MSGARAGKNAVLLWDQYNLGQFLSDGTVTAEQADLDATAWSTSSVERTLPGFTRTSGTFSGLFTASTGSTGSDSILSAAFGSTTPVLTWGPEGWTVGRVAKLIRATHNSYNIQSPVAGVVGVTAGVKGTTRYESGVWLKGLDAVTTTGSSTKVDGGAASSKGGVGHLHITAASTLGSMTVKVQHSSSSTAWSDLITFTASTHARAQRSTVSGTVKRYTRTTVSALTGGTGVSVTHAVSFARHI